jgi:hypothetical protein
MTGPLLSGETGERTKAHAAIAQWYVTASTDVYMTKSHWLGGGGGYGPGFYPDPPQNARRLPWNEAKYHAPGLVGNGHWEHVETCPVEPCEGACEAFVEVLRRKSDGSIHQLETQVWRYSLLTPAPSALRTERDTLAGQVAGLEAAQQQFIERIADWSQHAPDAAKRYQEIVQEARRQRTMLRRAALAGAGGQEAG